MTVEPLKQQALPVWAIFQLRQSLGLGGLEELLEEFAVNGKFSVEVSRIANAVAILGEDVFDVRFERCFVGLADHIPFSFFGIHAVAAHCCIAENRLRAV